MIVVSILGGFGNQLSAYACAYSVARELGEVLVLDISDYYAGYFRPYALDALDIPEHFKVIYPHKTGYYHGIYGAPTNFLTSFDAIVDTNEIQTRQDLLEQIRGKENVYIQGYGGLRFVTEADKAELKHMFRLRNVNKSLRERIDRIRSQQSVSIHIRRTDFVNNNWDIGADYYKAAIVYAEQMLGDIQLYIFSDDIEWSKKVLGTRLNYHYVSILGGMEADAEEMYCMSACKHHILSNRSTFGHWAAFLSTYDSGINIISGVDKIVEVSNRHILESDMIHELASKYSNYQEERKGHLDFTFLEQCLVENSNAQVINYIDNFCFDTWSVTEAERSRLLEYKGIAYLQEEDDAGTALSIFHNLQQKKREDVDFCYNYAVALVKSGRRLEGLVYSGKVLQMNNEFDITQYLGTLQSGESEIIELIRAIPRKHYVFLNIPVYENVNGYYESIAIMLRNLGNRVTILEFGNEKLFAGSMEMILNTAETKDKVYNWDLIKYKIGKINNVEEFSCIVDNLFGDEDIVFITHYVKGIVAKGTKYPLLFLDAISEWDSKKMLMSKYDNTIWREIYGAATKVITNHEISPMFMNKVSKPYIGTRVTKGDEVFFEKNRELYPGFYMRNEECIWGTLSVLKSVNEICQEEKRKSDIYCFERCTNENQIERLNREDENIMTDFKISIIIPCYNAEKYVERCIDSVLRQTIGMDEILLILVNDASKDRTQEILEQYEKQYPDNIIVINCEENVMPGGARNIGLTYAQGEYIMFMDADDFIDEDMLLNMYQYAKDTDCQILECQYAEFSQWPIKYDKSHTEVTCLEISDLEDRKRLLIRNASRTAVWGKLYRTDFVLENCLDFPEKVAYQDCYFTQMCSLYVERYAVTENQYYLYYHNNDGITWNKKKILKFLDEIVVQKTFWEMIKSRELTDDNFYPYREEVEYIAIQKMLIEPFVVCTQSGLNYADTPIKLLFESLIEVFPRFVENKYVCKSGFEIERLQKVLDCVINLKKGETKENNKPMIDNIDLEFGRLKREIASMKQDVEENNRMLNEILWAQVFSSARPAFSWLDKDLALWPGRWGVGYHYMYVVGRLLNDVCPKHILEAGLGQSTRLIASYVGKMCEEDRECEHIVLEHDQDWINIFVDEVHPSTATRIVCRDLGIARMRNHGRELETYVYLGLDEIVEGKKFDFISLDGPYGTDDKDGYSRIDILNYLPDCLAKSFCIVLDDYNRWGEKNTVEYIRQILRENNIAFCETVYKGVKDMYLLASADWKFLCTL